jgi:hypothetical protein
VGTGRELRLIAFRATSDGAALDGTLRDAVLPRITADHEVADAFVARRGPTDPGARLITTVRTPAGEASDAREVAEVAELAALRALGGDLFDPDTIDVVRRLPVAYYARFERPDPPRILRVFSGTVLPGRLDEYVARAAEGTEIDGRTIDGLAALCLAVEAPDDFVTVSAWRDWASIELATGGNVRRPMATRHAELIARGTAAHYELIGEVHESIATPIP